jgi:ferritin-like metal-binding protein YciE
MFAREISKRCLEGRNAKAHIEQSEEQRRRVEEALQQLGSKPDRTVCEAMRGLVEEAQHETDEHEKGPLLDLAIVASLQRVEHYEIAAYGTMAELATTLTEVTRSAIMPLALKQDDGESETAAPTNRSSAEGSARAPSSRTVRKSKCSQWLE